MQFRDLKKQYQVLKEKIDRSVIQVMTDCNFISGQQVKELESKLASYVGMKHCITCANGTDALTLALMAWGIGPGDAVFVPDFTFFSSGEVASFEGATPVFVDVDVHTFNIDPKSLEDAILAVEKEGKLKPRVVIPVDLFGLPADFTAILPIASKHNLMVLEDGAQGFGGILNGKRACSFGDISTTSFFPAKPLGCYGDGGAVFTNDDSIDELIRSIAVHGKGSFKYDNIRIGMNSRLDTIQAAILLIKLDAFEQYELSDVNNVAQFMNEKLKGKVQIPEISEGFYSSWAQYPIVLASEERRDQVQSKLKEQGIPTMVYYPKPMHLQQAFEGNKNYVPFPVTEALCKTILELPMHPYMTEEMVCLITSSIKELL